MTLQYTSLPDWAGEAGNRKRLEEWHAGFGEGGIPCPVCELRKVREDFRRLSQHLAAGKEKVTVKPAPPGDRRGHHNRRQQRGSRRHGQANRGRVSLRLPVDVCRRDGRVVG